MSKAAVIDEAISDAELALQLFVRWPAMFGGIVLRGDGPVRDEMVAFAKAEIGKQGPVVKIPSNVDSERLLGGLDLSATLAAGHGVVREGLLAGAAGGAVILPMAERLAANVAAHIAQAMDGGDIAVILLDDGHEPDEAPPRVLTERMAFHCDVSALRAFDGRDWAKAKKPAKVAPLDDTQLHAIALTAAALGIASVRPLIFAQSAARAHAALNGRNKVSDDDIAAAAGWCWLRARRRYRKVRLRPRQSRRAKILTAITTKTGVSRISTLRISCSRPQRRRSQSISSTRSTGRRNAAAMGRRGGRGRNRNRLCVGGPWARDPGFRGMAKGWR